MTNISVDISNRIDPQFVETIRELDDLSKQAGISYFILGASARDIFFETIYGIRAGRATFDIDLAMQVPSWEGFDRFVRLLLSRGRFKRVPNRPHRFAGTNGELIDVVPFGEIERPYGNIRWPTNQSDMSTVGFQEAFDNSMEAKIAERLSVRVSTPPSLVVTKLIAWDEAYPHRKRDAEDVDFIMQSYLDAGQEHRLYNGDRDITELATFDRTTAGARMLGRDISKVVHADTLNRILPILERETDENAHGRLIRDMMQRRIDFDEEYAQKQALLNELKLGMLDGKHRTT